MDGDKGLGPGYWNCLHRFNVGDPVWGEPGKEANIAGCKKCKQEIKKCTHWFCRFKLNTCWQMTASPIDIVKINLYLFSPMKATHLESTTRLEGRAYKWCIFIPMAKICTILVVECSCIHAQATCSLFCSGSDIKWCVSCEMQVYSFCQDHKDYYMNMLRE